MSHDLLERFSNNIFLLERARVTIRHLSQRGKRHTLSFIVRVLLFLGLLGLMWTLSHLNPKGDLSLYMIPITLLALPVAFIAPNEARWERVVNGLFVVTFVGVVAWCVTWYFSYPAWGYQLRWLSLEAALVGLLAWGGFKRRSRSWDAPQQSLMRALWLVGVISNLLALAFVSHYLISQETPEADTANLITTSTFIALLALTLVRVYWLDSLRHRRANRGEYTRPPDYVLILEWLIPRSYAFTVVLALLLVSESMMFSTIYRANVGLSSPPPPPQEALLDVPPQVLPREVLPQDVMEGGMSTLDAPPPQADALHKGRSREVHLSEWIFFSFKPYVFPKDHEGREVDAPPWFKVLGRALLGLIIAILLTKQLNIWKQLSGLYVNLIGAYRRAEHLGDTEELARQRLEMKAGLGAMFNTHATFWRWRLFKAVTAPTLTLGWRLLLDPASAYYLGLERAQRRLSERWDNALLSLAILISLCTLPVALFNDLAWPFIPYALAPIWGVGLLLWVLRALVGLKAPRSYEWWIWWLLGVHLVSALINFFLSFNIGSREAFWPTNLWYTQLVTVGVFCVLYLVGGDRHRHASTFGRRIDVSDHDADYVTRVELLHTFMHTEHRQWLAQRITLLLHPVRSGTLLQVRLLWSSLLLGALDTLRGALTRLGALITQMSYDERSAIKWWSGLQGLVGVSAFLTHLFASHKWLPRDYWWVYTINLILLLTPSALMRAQVSLQARRVNSAQAQDNRLTLRLVGMISGSLSLIVWFTLYSQWSTWRALSEYTGWSALMIIPLLPLWTTFKGSRADRGGAQSHHISEHIERLLTNLAERLQRIEQRALKNAYQLANKAHPLELNLRYELLEGSAKLLELSYQDLQSGRWYEEESHAIRRVYRHWFGVSDEEGEGREIAEELTLLQEHLIDSLGSLLYDVTLTDRFGAEELIFTSPYQEVKESTREQGNLKAPYIKALLSTLTRVARLPRPTSLCELKGISEPLHELYETLEHLTWTLLLSAHPTLRTELKALLADEESEPQMSTEGALKGDKAEGERKEHLEGALSRDVTLREVLLSAERTLSCELTPTLTTQLIELLCLLNEPHAEGRLHLCRSLLTPRELLRIARDAACSEQLLEELLEDLQKEEMPEAQDLADEIKEALLTLQLPTPIAERARSLISTCEALNDARSRLSAHERLMSPHTTHKNKVSKVSQVRDERLAVTQEISARSAQLNEALKAVSLNSLQHPEAFEHSRERLKLIDEVERCEMLRSRELRGAYLCVFGFLFALLKDRAHEHLAHASREEERVIYVLQDLAWTSPNELRQSVALLKRERLPEPLAPLREALLELLQMSDLKLIERAHLSEREWSRAVEMWRGLLARLSEVALPLCPPLVWCGSLSEHPVETSADTPVAPPQALLLRGLSPQRCELTGDPWVIGRGVRFEGSDERPEIDYYTALWVLRSLNTLAHSDALFMGARSQGEERALVDRDILARLTALTERFGKLLRSFAPEEQRVIEELYDLISRRLTLFETLTPEELKSLEGQGEVNFEHAFQKLKDYLDSLEGSIQRRFQHLLKLGLTPSREFLFLSGIEPHRGSELRWYDSVWSDLTSLTLISYTHERGAVEGEGVSR